MIFEVGNKVIFIDGITENGVIGTVIEIKNDSCVYPIVAVSDEDRPGFYGHFTTCGKLRTVDISPSTNIIKKI